MYNYIGIATRYSYSLSASSVRYARRLWLHRVYFYKQLNTYTVQVQIVTVYALVHVMLLHCCVIRIVVLCNTHSSAAYYA